MHRMEHNIGCEDAFVLTGDPPILFVSQDIAEVSEIG